MEFFGFDFGFVVEVRGYVVGFLVVLVLFCFFCLFLVNFEFVEMERVFYGCLIMVRR